MPFTGIILAGGKSTRMGTEKGLVLFKGKPLINYALDVLNQLCDEVLISSNVKSYDHLGYKVIPDIYPGIGPMGGIYSCLKQSRNDLNLVLSCDMPFVTDEIFKHLLDVRENALVCVPWHKNDHYEPLCGIYHHQIIDEMNVFISQKNYKLPDLFKSSSFIPVNINQIDPPLNKHYFFSINSTADIALAEERLSI
jgi:molybdopterin-guanine dinucleotide biosynthesis protein A